MIVKFALCKDHHLFVVAISSDFYYFFKTNSSDIHQLSGFNAKLLKEVMVAEVDVVSNEVFKEKVPSGMNPFALNSFKMNLFRMNPFRMKTQVLLRQTSMNVSKFVVGSCSDFILISTMTKPDLN